MAWPNIIAINVGNTRTHIGRVRGGKLEQSERFGGDVREALVDRVREWWQAIGEISGAAIVLASVNSDVADGLVTAIEKRLSIEVYRVGDDLPVPIGTQLDPETVTGVDRLLNAAAAYDRVKQACVVVDAGTAVTVDFVDGEGTFHGGAIAPGGEMQLKSLYEHTAALPEVAFNRPDREAFGRCTRQAMLHGVFYGIRGMIWKLVELYAERYGAYPMVIATGGDAELLLGDDELVDRIVPDLTLLGIAAAARYALAEDETADLQP